MTDKPLNVLGTELLMCCDDPVTGFYRDGYCNTGVDDLGLHIVCSEMTEEFLKFSAQKGNDLSTPREEFDFPGLKPGDKWCLCALRWKEAFDAGVCLLYTSPSPRDATLSRMPSSA